MPRSTRSVGLALVLALSALTTSARADGSAPSPSEATGAATPLPPLPPPSSAEEQPAAPVEVSPTTAPTSRSPLAPMTAPCAESPDGCAAESRAPTRSGWYGYQTLITDSIAVTLAFASAKLGGAAAAGSFGTYVLGGPIVHVAHGRPAMFAASLGTRLVSPVLGAVTGFAIGAGADGCRGGGDYVCGGPIAGAGIGLLSGLAAAVTLDAALYSRAPRSAEPERKAWDGKPSVAPSVSASPTGGSVGVGGVF